MTAATLFADLTSRGVEFELQGDRLRFRPTELVTADEVALIREHKAEIVELLSATTPAVPSLVDGAEHFSLYVDSALGPWPEFEPGVDYDVCQPSTLRGLCHPPTAPIQPDRLRQVLTTCDRCGSAEFLDTLIHNGESTRRDCGRCHRFMGWPAWKGQP
jgi:hypothetical protein